jgi:Polyketide cyclase / dehydrase and lipid transport
MAHAEETVMIDRSAEEVFDFLADGSNNGRWRAGVIEVADQSGDGAGAVWGQTMRGPGGRTIQGNYCVTDHDRPRRLGFEVIAGPARPLGVFTLPSRGHSSTTLSFTLDLRPRGMMRLMAPMVQRQMVKEVGAIRNLRQVLEARRCQLGGFGASCCDPLTSSAQAVMAIAISAENSDRQAGRDEALGG